MSRIVYAGALAHGSTSSFRADALRRAGHDVYGVETDPGSADYFRALVALPEPGRRSDRHRRNEQAVD